MFESFKSIASYIFLLSPIFLILHFLINSMANNNLKGLIYLVGVIVIVCLNYFSYTFNVAKTGCRYRGCV